jgi:hypothetical protein
VKRFALDLHLHTTLSSCADRTMSPLAVAVHARECGLSLIALCDHDRVGAAHGLVPVPGLEVLHGVEITTFEKTHLLGILPSWDAARALAADLGLPCGWDPERPVLQGPCPTLPEGVQAIHRAGGVAIAAHVDRPSSGLLGRVGCIPEVGLDAIELSASGLCRMDTMHLEQYGLPVLVGSDSHDLSEIGSVFCTVSMRSACFEELVRALRDASDWRCDCA